MQYLPLNTTNFTFVWPRFVTFHKPEDACMTGSQTLTNKKKCINKYKHFKTNGPFVKEATEIFQQMTKPESSG